MFADRGHTVPMDPFERWLADGLAIEPPAAALERIERRVRSVLAGPIPIDHRRRFGRRTVLVLLLAAALAAMGAGAGLLGLYDTIFGPVQGWRLAYDRAEPLAMVVTSGDVRATLDRGYADANEVAVFVSAVDIADNAQPTFDIGFSLVDGDGREYQGTSAGGAPDNAFAAAMFVFETPEPWLTGTRHFTLTIPSFSDPRAMATDPSPEAGRIAGGPFVYQFELTTQGGQVALPGPPSSAAGQTVTLRELVVSAASIRGVLVIEPKPAGEPLRRQVVVRLGSRAFRVAAEDYEGEGDKLVFTFWTVEGIDSPPSTGSVEVTGLGPDASPVPDERWSVPFVLSAGNPSPGSGQTPAPPASVGLRPETTSWTEVGLDSILEGGSLRGVVPLGEGFLGVGQATAPGPGVAAAWTSPDGLAWTRTATIAAPLSDVSGVARGADAGTIVAIGSQANDRTMAWTSSDGGVSWSGSELSAPVAGLHFAALRVVAGDGGFLVLGHYQPDTGEAWPAGVDPLTPLLWHAADGRAWSRVEIPQSRIQVDTIAATRTGFLAGGARLAGSSWIPAMWTSPDGEAWSAANSLPRDPGVGAPGPIVNAIAAGPDLVLAVSNRVDEAAGQVWSSVDGTTWQAIGDRRIDDPLAHLLTWTQGQFILAGLVGDTPGDETLVVSASADGAEWAHLLAQPAPTGENPGSIAISRSGIGLVSFARSLLVGTPNR